MTAKPHASLRHRGAQPSAAVAMAVAVAVAVTALHSKAFGLAPSQAASGSSV